MLRITASTCECGERLELEGRLTAPYLSELESAVARARQRGRVSLDVSELIYVDSEGARALRELRRQQVEVHATSAFVAELLGLDSLSARPRGGPCPK